MRRVITVRPVGEARAAESEQLMFHMDILEGPEIEQATTDMCQVCGEWDASHCAAACREVRGKGSQIAWRSMPGAHDAPSRDCGFRPADKLT